MSEMKDRDPLLLDHEADGIKELDNLLPRWWVWLFYLTIVFGVVYLGYYHVLRLGAGQIAEYDREYEVGQRIKAAAVAKFEATVGTLTPSNDRAILADGERVFVQMCAPCHRVDGGGLVGPNLCDDYWIHGSNFVDNVKVILNGVPEKGMLTWRGLLKPSEIQAVASYIQGFRGTRPPNPKPPENQQAQPTGPSAFE